MIAESRGGCDFRRGITLAVVDVPGDTTQSRVVEGTALPLAGDGGWTRGETLLDEAQRSLATVACPKSDEQQSSAGAVRPAECRSPAQPGAHIISRAP